MHIFLLLPCSCLGSHCCSCLCAGRGPLGSAARSLGAGASSCCASGWGGVSTEASPPTRLPASAELSGLPETGHSCLMWSVAVGFPISLACPHLLSQASHYITRALLCSCSSPLSIAGVAFPPVTLLHGDFCRGLCSS